MVEIIITALFPVVAYLAVYKAAGNMVSKNFSLPSQIIYFLVFTEILVMWALLLYALFKP
jgi:hypothetical protein